MNKNARGKCLVNKTACTHTLHYNSHDPLVSANTLPQSASNAGASEPIYRFKGLSELIVEHWHALCDCCAISCMYLFCTLSTLFAHCLNLFLTTSFASCFLYLCLKRIHTAKEIVKFTCQWLPWILIIFCLCAVLIVKIKFRTSCLTFVRWC